MSLLTSKPTLSILSLTGDSMKRLLIVWTCFSVIAFSNTCLAQTSTYSNSNKKLKTFLTACAYGTVGGALLGLASLAFISNPSDNYGNIAKGASLGLYGGIIYGYISATSTPAVTPPADVDTSAGMLYLSPQVSRGQISGTQLNYQAASF